MNSISSIASSALAAYGIKQAVTANNVANSETPDFKVSSVTMQEIAGGGVKPSVIQGNDSVELSSEAVNMISASQAFKANTKAFQVADEMTKELLNIMA